MTFKDKNGDTVQCQCKGQNHVPPCPFAPPTLVGPIIETMIAHPAPALVPAMETFTVPASEVSLFEQFKEFIKKVS